MIWELESWKLNLRIGKEIGIFRRILIPLYGMFENVVDRISLSTSWELNRIHGLKVKIAINSPRIPTLVQEEMKLEAWRNSGPCPGPCFLPPTSTTLGPLNSSFLILLLLLLLLLLLFALNLVFIKIISLNNHSKFTFLNSNFHIYSFKYYYFCCYYYYVYLFFKFPFF